MSGAGIFFLWGFFFNFGVFRREREIEVAFLFWGFKRERDRKGGRVEAGVGRLGGR